MGLDLSFIQLDESILDGINVISDTLNYDNRECYVVDFYKMRKNRKVGPLSKFWIDVDNYNIYKIQKFNRRERMLSEVVFEEYSDKYHLIFANGGDQKNNEIPESKICERLGIELIDGLGGKIQSSSWLLKNKL